MTFTSEEFPEIRYGFWKPPHSLITLAGTLTSPLLSWSFSYRERSRAGSLCSGSGRWWVGPHSERPLEDGWARDCILGKKKAGGAGAVQMGHKALGDRVCVQDTLGPVPGQGVQPARCQSPTGTTHCPGRHHLLGRLLRGLLIEDTAFYQKFLYLLIEAQ